MKKDNKKKLKNWNFKWVKPLATVGAFTASTIIGTTVSLVASSRKEKTPQSPKLDFKFAAPSAASSTTSPIDIDLSNGGPIPSLSTNILKKGETPAYIYTFPKADFFKTNKAGDQGTDISIVNGKESVAGNVMTYLKQLTSQLQVLNLDSQNFVDKITDIYKAIAVYSGWTGNTSFLQDATNAFSQLLDEKQLDGLYNVINQFPDGAFMPTDSLSIVKPSAIYDLVGTQPSGVDLPAPKPIQNMDFRYEVADIALGKLKDQGSLAFTFEDQSKPDHANHDYHIVISNENKDINSYLTSIPSMTDTNFGTLQSLLDTKAIFVRDLKNQAAAPTDASIALPNDFSDKVEFGYSYDKATKAPMLRVFIKPSDDNKNSSTAIKFGVDATTGDPAASKQPTLKYGLLDNSLAPSHMKVNTDTQVIKDIEAGQFPIVTDFANPIGSDITTGIKSTDLSKAGDVQIFSDSGVWAMKDGSGFNSGSAASSTALNVIRMFMLPGSHYSHDVMFNGKAGADPFNGDHAIELTYGTPDSEGLKSDFQVKPANGFIITKIAADSSQGADLTGQSLIRFSSYDTGAPKLATNPQTNLSYAKVELGLNNNTIAFNPVNSTTPDEQPLEINNIAEKIFFEDPYKKAEKTWGTTSTSSDRKAQWELRNESTTTTLDQDTVLIGDVIGNWAGQMTPATGGAEPRYIDKNTSIFVKGTPQDPKITQQFPATAAGFASFSSALTQAPWNGQNIPNFAYQYTQWAIDPQTNRVVKIQPNNSPVLSGLYQQDANFYFDQTNPQELDADGVSIFKHFNSYINQLSDWTVSRLGLPKNTIGWYDKDAFNITSQNKTTGYAKQTLIGRGGIDGEKLKNVSAMLVHLWNDDALNTQENGLLTELHNTFDKTFPDFETKIKGINKQAKGQVAFAGYAESKQYIYYLLQPYVVRSLNSILKTITDQFENNRNLALGTAFKKFLNTNDSNTKKLNSTLMQQIDTTSDSLFANSQFIAVGSYGSEAGTGADAINSLIGFINDSGLQNRFLDQTNVDAFNNFIKNRYPIQASYFDDSSNQQEFISFMGYINDIMKKTFMKDKDDSYVAFDTIVNKIVNGEYNDVNADAFADLEKTISAAITTITQGETYGTLKFIGTESEFTYIQSLAIGKNLQSIFEKYIELHKSVSQGGDGKITGKEQGELEQYLQNQQNYNPEKLTDLAISLGYYNLDYFVDALTNSSKVLKTAHEMLNDNLEKQIKITISSDNQVINFLSDPNKFTRFAFDGIGVGTFIIGSTTFGLSFRRSIRAGKKSVVIERVMFGAIMVLGIALAALGFIPGIL